MSSTKSSSTDVDNMASVSFSTLVKEVAHLSSTHVKKESSSISRICRIIIILPTSFC